MGWEKLSSRIRERMEELGVNEEDLLLVLDIRREKLRRMLDGDFSVDDEFHIKEYLRRICKELELSFEELEKEYLEDIRLSKKSELKVEPQKRVYTFMIIFLSFFSIFLFVNISKVSKMPIAVLKNTSGEVIEVSGVEIPPGDDLEIFESVRVSGNPGEVLIETYGGKVYRVRIRNFEVMVSGRGEGSRPR